MGIAFRVLGAALKDYYEEMFMLAGANLLCVVLAIPVITLPPALAGMYYLTNRIAHRKSVELGMFFEGFRKYFVTSWLLTLLNLLAAFLFWINLVFYGQFESSWSMMVRGLLAGIFAIWFLIQIYVFPMLLEQEEPRLRLALRNAAFLAFASPITTLTLAVLVLLLGLLSVALALPFAVAMMALIGLMANEAVLALLVHFGIRKPPEEAEA